MAFESLDFIDHPSGDVKRDAAYFTDVLGGRRKALNELAASGVEKAARY